MAKSPNTELILNYMKKVFPTAKTKQEIQADLGIQMIASVTGVMNSLEKKGYATHTEETVEVAAATETKKAQTKVFKYHVLTEEGLAYDPAAEEAKALEAKAAAKAAKATAAE